MKIKVMSKGEIQNKIIPNSVVIINYYDFLGFSLFKTQNHSLVKNESIIYLNDKKQILSICADDININVISTGAQPISYLSEVQAEQIVDFIIKHKDKTIVFQCDYGKSRSLSTAVFAKDYILKEHDFSHKENVVRNQSFYNLLLEIYNKKLK